MSSSPSLERRPPAPTADRKAFPVTKIPLRSFVHHRHTVLADEKLERVYSRFRELDVDFVAVCQGTQVVGLMGRKRLGFLMGSRFGFSLYSNSPARQFVLPHCLIVAESAPLHELLDAAFSRQGDAFYEDVMLVDEAGALVGLINVENLARLQTRLVAEQLGQLAHQHETLREQNLTLFRTNHALRQSRGLYQGLFESEALGVALLSPKGEVELYNPRFGELIGLDERYRDGVGLADRMGGMDRDSFLRLLKAHADRVGRVDATREYTVQVPGRQHRVFRVTTGWIHETGQICASFDDVTEQRALEQAVMREEKQRLLDTLVGGIAHELNNKLTPVLAFAEILRRKVDSDLVFHTESIRNSAQEAAKIIRQLLQFSKPSSDDAGLVDLRTVIDESLPMVNVTIRDRCSIELRQAAEPVWVSGDPGQLKQVLINLILNAWHAVEGLDDPRIVVSLEALNGQAELTVEDNGAGVPLDLQSRIFDPFFTTKGPDQGTGLGLSICFSIVRQHGGEVVVHSQPDAGARFVVSLPVRGPEALSALHMDGMSAPLLFAPAERDRRCRVLVVDDEDVLRSVLREMLRSQFGCEIEMAADGREGLAALRSRAYDLVISDVRMPKMNGVEFYEAIAAVRAEQQRRFVFVTGYVGDKDEVALPPDVPVLAKPFSLHEFESLCGPYLNEPDGHDSSDRVG
ncbi:ATP-binding protein [Synoicihabitans lomoniglobus]|uniref:histidine kinase n=1 Tax=Synoicihabitans lomoniglobus TaxID=2909285 RepID=A0AAE9ZYX6_9BACT|nr:ATP-binding protein [Opitutaceae bacterium LMO-M01]WED65213.1 ATP-binding protein [Opitutaceae bacterium LMO-M01]